MAPRIIRIESKTADPEIALVIVFHARSRNRVGDFPVQRLKARIKLLRSEKPSMKAISVIDSRLCSIYPRASSWRVSSSNCWNDIPARDSFACSVLALICTLAAMAVRPNEPPLKPVTISAAPGLRYRPGPTSPGSSSLSGHCAGPVRGLHRTVAGAWSPGRNEGQVTPVRTTPGRMYPATRRPK